MNFKVLLKNSFIYILLVISCVTRANHVAWDSEHPSSEWLTQETEHFTINFLSEQQHDAEKVLRIAEQVHKELQPFFNTTPNLKTQIVLVDDYDYSNGWATPIPYPQIRVIMQPPGHMDDLITIGEWLPSLIRHEYTHILHMEMGSGKVEGVRKLIGRNVLTFPHVFIPPMFLEGLAVYTETNKHYGYGRLQSSMYDMVMRMEVAENAVKDFSEVTAASNKHPLGMHYYYGSYFIDFLVHEYGEEKMMEFFQTQSQTITPFLFINYNAWTTFGKSFYTLWGEFQTYLKEMYSPEISSLKKGLVQGKEISHSPFKQIVAATDNGLIINKNNGSSTSGLVLFDNDGEEVQKLVSTSGVMSLNYSSHYGLVATRSAAYKSGVVYGDLYRLVDNSWQRLTHKERFTNARWMAETAEILASRNVGGKSELWQVSLDGTQKSLVWQGDEGEILGDYTVSKDGEFLVAALKRSYHGWDLEKFDLKVKKWHKLVDTKEVEFSPSFMPNGELLFSADYNGVFNIFSLNLQTNAITQLTSELGGAFAPVWQPGMGLVYQAYHHDGYKTKVISKAKLKSLKKINLDKVKHEYSYPKLDTKKTNLSAVSKYSPINTLMPQTYLPRIYGVYENIFYGLSVSGQDALSRHVYDLGVDYNPDDGLWAYNFSYAYDNRFTLSSSRQIRELQEHHSYDIYKGYSYSKEFRANTNVELTRHNIYPMLDDSLTFALGMGWNRLSKTTMTDESNSVYFGGAAIFNDKQKLYNLPGDGVGIKANFVIESNTDFKDQDRFNFSKNDKRYTMQAKLSNSLELPYYSVLSLDLNSGYTNSSLQPFEVGGVFIINRDLMGIFNNKSLDLPGYQDASMVGSKYLKSEASVSTLLSRIDRNLWAWPVGLGDLGSRVFFDSASVWNDGYTPKNIKHSVGIELDSHLKFGYNARVNIATGFAKGLDKNSGFETFYVNFGREF